MLRRHALKLALLAPVPGAAAVTGCQRTPKREQVLRSLGDDVMAKGIRDAVRAGHDLQAAVVHLAAAPSANAAATAQAAWVNTAVKWKRANALRDQQLSAGSELVRAAFWPPRPRAIEELVRSDLPLTDADVEKLGADVRSLYAMEYLLFAERSGSSFQLAALENARARQALVAFSGSLSRRGAAVEAGLATGSVGARLAAQGQDALNRLVAIAVGNIESLVANRLATIVWIASTKRSRPLDIEGGPSGISHRLAAAVLEVSAQLYAGEQGQGLGALVAAVAAPAHERIRGAFLAAVAAIQSFAEPLETVALTDRSKIDGLLAKCKSLEVALRSDLASALGVTLTFSSSDAD